MAVRYRGAGAVVGEASWDGLAKLIMSGALGETAEVWSHESGGKVSSGMCSVGDLIDVSDAAEADEDDVEEIAATLQDAFLERCSDAAAAASEPEPELEPAALLAGVPASPLENFSAKQCKAFDEAKAQLAGIMDLDVLAYLKSRDWNVQKAVTQCQVSQFIDYYV